MELSSLVLKQHKSNCSPQNIKLLSLSVVSYRAIKKFRNKNLSNS